MYIFFEEGGRFHFGVVLADQGSSLQVEIAATRKRVKVKETHILLRFETTTPSEFIKVAEEEANTLDIQFLWEICGTQEFNFLDLTANYYGHTPKPIEAVAMAMVLQASPVYFYKRGKGRYQAAPLQSLQAALAGIERRKQESLQIDNWVEELVKKQLPTAFAPHLSRLLYEPDKSSLYYRALVLAATRLQISPLQLLLESGAAASSHLFHLNRFLWHHFPKGIEHPVYPVEGTTKKIDLPKAPAPAFSIDDRTTTEIDDAFSVQHLTNGETKIGVHIALPALTVLPESALDHQAEQRLSTVYFPGNKITMLPESIIGQFSLDAGHWRPVLSMYVQIDKQGEVLAWHTAVEQIQIAANLRLGEIAETFVDADWEMSVDPYQKALAVLWRTAQKLEAARLAVTGKPEPVRTDYNFYVENGEQGERICIEARQRGSPLDKLVAEWMIFVNTQWGALLAEAKAPGLYRTQRDGKVRMSTQPEVHEGLGVPQYLWASSPLRRYIDLVNQRQILAVVEGRQPIYAKQDPALYRIMTVFETTYAAYHEFQHQMEHYWCLRWLQQEGTVQVTATVIRENLVRFDNLPIVMRIANLSNLERGKTVLLQIGHIDLFESSLEAQYLKTTTSAETP